MKTERFFYSKPVNRTYFTGYTDPYMGNLKEANAVVRATKTIQLPRICICGIFDKDTNRISFGISRCSHKDQFVKKIAKDLARQRAIENPYAVIEVGDNKIYDVFISYSRKFESEILQTHPININKSK